MNLINEITKFSTINPHKVAVKGLQFQVTYQQLEEKINQTANAFKTLGVKENERVLIQIGNRVEFLYSYFAAMKMNAIIVPINPTYTPDEMSFIASDCQPSLYICEQASKENIDTIKKQSKKLKHFLLLDEADEALSFDAQIAQQSNVHESFVGDDHAVCEILYTSGTTGLPKGAMLTHDGLAGNAKTYSEILQCNEQDIALIVAPLYHAASQTNCLNTMIVSGATCYIMPKFSPNQVLDILQDEEISYFFGPPTMYTILLNNEQIEKYTFNLRIAFTGAASMPVSIHKRWKEIFGFDILEGYGLSECSPIVANHRPGEVIKYGSVGPALPGVMVKIVDEKDQEVPIGEVGEVVVKGPNVMKGYWNRPEETNETLRNGWLHTGDLGYQDKDAYYYIVDRQKDMINQGGMKIYPREIEEVLYQYNSFLEVGVVGEPDEVMGENVVAYVTLKNPEDAQEIGDFEAVKDFCKKKLAPYKIPKKFYIIDEMPKTLSGKIRKTELVK